MSDPTKVGVNPCDYELLDNGIHYFRFNQATKEALDQHFEVLLTLMLSNPAGTIIPAILDFRPAGFPPVSYAFQRVREMTSRYPKRAYFRYAFVHPPNVLVSAVKSLFQLLRSNDQARFFPAHEYDAAVAWLVQSIKAE